MTEVPLPPSQRVKLISELLMAFKRLLPKLTEDYQIRKVNSDIRNHMKWRREARNEIRRQRRKELKDGNEKD